MTRTVQYIGLTDAAARYADFNLTEVPITDNDLIAVLEDGQEVRRQHYLDYGDQEHKLSVYTDHERKVFYVETVQETVHSGGPMHFTAFKRYIARNNPQWCNPWIAKPNGVPSGYEYDSTLGEIHMVDFTSVAPWCSHFFPQQIRAIIYDKEQKYFVWKWNPKQPVRMDFGSPHVLIINKKIATVQQFGGNYYLVKIGEGGIVYSIQKYRDKPDMSNLSAEPRDMISELELGHDPLTSHFH